MFAFIVPLIVAAKLNLIWPDHHGGALMQNSVRFRVGAGLIGEAMIDHAELLQRYAGRPLGVEKSRGSLQVRAAIPSGIPPARRRRPVLNTRGVNDPAYNGLFLELRPNLIHAGSAIPPTVDVGIIGAEFRLATSSPLILCLRVSVSGLTASAETRRP